ncbi:MAG: hypothetical protein H8K07_20490 [Nitrospira sp.]|nr:hypothetical protein [Nitrospira sp.]
MQLAKDIQAFSSACEHILSAVAMNRPPTSDEAAMLEYYCVEILAKIAPHLPKPTNHHGREPERVTPQAGL